MKNQAPNRIAALRKARGLTQEQLAAAIGAHLVTISNLERGKARLTKDWGQRIADALKLDYSELFNGDERRSSTIYVRGVVSANARMYTFDLEDQQPLRVSFVRPVDDALAEWFVVDGEALHPVFQHGDLIQVSPTGDSDPAKTLGFLSAMILKDDTVYLGIPTKFHGKNRFDVYRFNGPPLVDVRVKAHLRVTMAIFRPDFPAGQHTIEDPENPPSRVGLAEWLKKRLT